MQQETSLDEISIRPTQCSPRLVGFIFVLGSALRPSEEATG